MFECAMSWLEKTVVWAARVFVLSVGARDGWFQVPNCKNTDMWNASVIRT